MGRRGVIMVAETNDETIGIRVPKWLKEALREDAKKSGWKLSNQIVFELMERRGKWQPPTPYLPSFTKPTQEAPGKRKRTA